MLQQMFVHVYFLNFTVVEHRREKKKCKTNAIDYIILKSANEGSDQRIHKKETISLF